MSSFRYHPTLERLRKDIHKNATEGIRFQNRLTHTKENTNYGYMFKSNDDEYINNIYFSVLPKALEKERIFNYCQDVYRSAHDLQPKTTILLFDKIQEAVNKDSIKEQVELSWDTYLKKSYVYYSLKIINYKYQNKLYSLQFMYEGFDKNNTIKTQKIDLTRKKHKESFKNFIQNINFK